MRNPETIFYQIEPAQQGPDRWQPAPPDASETIEKYRQDTYSWLDREIAVRNDALPRTEIADFFHNLDLQPPNLVVFDSSKSLGKLGEVAPQQQQHFTDDPNLKGENAADLGIAFLAADRQPAGPRRTSLAVHEMAHGTGRNAIGLRSTNGSISQEVSRAGFVLNGGNNGTAPILRHHLLDEGRAELLADQFMIQTGQPVFDGYLDYNGLMLPASYVFDENGSLIVSQSAPAAVCLELLIAKDPSLLENFISGSNDTEILRDTARKIEALQPGLYSKLGRVKYSLENFAVTAQDIINALYDGDYRAPLHSHELTERLMAAKSQP